MSYDPRLPDINDIAKKAWSVMVEDEKMKTTFPEPPMICYKRVQSLRDILVKAKLPASRLRTSRRAHHGFKPCGQSKCPVCDQLKVKNKVISSITCSTTGEEIGIKTRLTCISKNLVYCITCTRGGRVCPTHPQYIGETKKELKERLRGHRGTITQECQENTTAPVGVHFRSQGHSICDLSLIHI